MILISSFILLLLKIFLGLFIKLLLWEAFFLKDLVFVIIIGIFIFFNVFQYNPLTYNFPQSFILNSFRTHLWNGLILLAYFMVFIIGILYLRISNVERQVDLTSFYNEILLAINTLSFFSFLINLLLLLMFIVLYIKLFSLLIQYIKAHIIRRHIYYSTMLATNIYCFLYEVFNDYFSIEKFYHCLTMTISFLFHCLGLKKYNEEAFTYSFRTRLLSASYKYAVEFAIYKFLRHYQYTMHRLICSMILLYDVIFNDFIITNIYTLLPYVFLYEIWSRVSLFYANVSLNKDDILNTVLYTKEWVEVPFSDGKEFFVGNHTITLNMVQELLHEYLFVGLVDPEFGIKNNNKYIIHIIVSWERLRLWVFAIRYPSTIIIPILSLILVLDFLNI